MSKRLKLGDIVVIDKIKYEQEEFKFLLRKDLRIDLDKKVINEETAKIVFLESYVADLEFSDGKVHIVDRKSLNKV